MNIYAQLKLASGILESIEEELQKPISIDPCYFLDPAVLCQISINRIVFDLNKMMEEDND